MAIKPTDIIYGNDEKPPVITTVFQGIQHVLLAIGVLLFPMLLLAQFNDSATAERMIQGLLLSMGVATILLTLARRFIGADILLISGYDPANYSMSWIALKMGGLPLLYTVNYLQALVQILFSGCLLRLRRFFPVEIAGLIIFMTALSLITVAVSNCLGGVDEIQHLHWDVHACIISASTLVVMIIASIWGGKAFARYGLFIGVIFGLLLTTVLGWFTPQTVLENTQLFSLPHLAGFHITLWHWDYLFPLLIAVIAMSLKTMGNIIAMQKINDADWTRPDMNKVRNGIFTLGLTNILSSLLGGLPVGTSTPNVGLAVSTHITSRRIGWFVGALFIVVSFFPIISEILVIIPKPILGAVVLYVLSSILVSGIQIMMSRMMDSRRMFLIGLPIIIGLAFEFIPQLELDVAPLYRPIVESPLTTATILGLILNIIFLIGARHRTKNSLAISEDTPDEIQALLQKYAGAWGAVPNTIYRANKALSSTLRAIKPVLEKNQIELNLDYDEYQLIAEVDYVGKALKLDLTNTIQSLLQDHNNPATLALHDAESYADTMECLSQNTHQKIRLVFVQ